MAPLMLPNLGRFHRFFVLLLTYAVVLITSTWVAYGLRFDFAIPEAHQEHFQGLWPWIWSAKLLILMSAGQFSSLLSYFSLPDLKKMATAMALATLLVLGLWQLSTPFNSMSRGVIVLDGVFSFLGLAACRLVFRLLRQGIPDTTSPKLRHVGIVGAGDVGAALARELQIRGRLKPVVFFDDAKHKAGTQVHGIPVKGPLETMDDSDAPQIDEMIIAMPLASGTRINSIVTFLGKKEIQCRTIPSLSQLAAGEMTTALRPVEVGDILGRETTDLVPEGLRDFYLHETVLVTGAGGSIGSELCRQLVRFGVARLILLERSESSLFDIHSELNGKIDCIPELVDITDSEGLRNVLLEHRPNVVFHAAAFKHVGLLESNPAMAVQNNILGTHTLAQLAREESVDRVILISTDKAVSPTNVMGATKRVAEKLFEGHALETNKTRFVSVRFGNVLGSSGSVVPIFQRQIEAGGPVTVRDAEVTRYFMSIPEAANLVLCGGMLGENGDRFILDMGEAVKIIDLARQMIRLSGKEPEKEIGIKITGLGPGEKRSELLHYPDEELKETAHAKILRVQGPSLDAVAWNQLQSQLSLIKTLNDSDAIAWLQVATPEYQAK